jgi:MOSC domain-containing protein YiiM
LNGDWQADITVYKELDKSVYVYPFEPYDGWRSEESDTELPLGIFGENFTLTATQLEALQKSWCDSFQR